MGGPQVRRGHGSATNVAARLCGAAAGLGLLLLGCAHSDPAPRGWARFDSVYFIISRYPSGRPKVVQPTGWRVLPNGLELWRDTWVEFHDVPNDKVKRTRLQSDWAVPGTPLVAQEGTPIDFWPNGAPRRFTLREDREGRFRAGTLLEMDAQGAFLRYTIARPANVGGVAYPAGTEFRKTPQGWVATRARGSS